MNPLKKWWGLWQSGIWSYVSKFKFFKNHGTSKIMELQKVFVLLWKTIVWTLRLLTKYHSPSEVPFKFPLPFYKVKIGFMYIVLLKFVFSKKSTQIDKIFTVYLTITTWCQIICEDFINFCGQLRKNELYSTGFN